MNDSEVHYPETKCGEPHPDHPDCGCIHNEGHAGLPITFGGHPMHLTFADGDMLVWRTPIVVPVDGAELYANAQGNLGPTTSADITELLAVDPEAYTVRPLVADELAEAEAEIGEADGWMRMVDPACPWLMRTSDGGAWIQCADCDTWIQATPGMTLEQATLLADYHRATTYPHVQNVQVGRPMPRKLTRRERRKAEKAARKGN